MVDGVRRVAVVDEMYVVACVQRVVSLFECSVGTCSGETTVSISLLLLETTERTETKTVTATLTG